MAIPSGAHTIVYSVSQYAEGTEVYLQVAFDIGSNTPALIDAAAQAAMESFVATLESLTPQAAVQAARVYECGQAGDAWPEP
jgi:hypothetical protein